ncbi:MAG: hypothetical protein KKD69_09785, partial [Euryarchaeota archaeon]|nr:hypothetical protein [Euryarchaeota archaeon]
IYQGTIRKDSAIYTGQIDAVFRITNQDGSIEYWTSGSTTVYVNGGLFRYILGSPNEAQFNAIQWLNIDPYIETTVDGLTLPRDKLNTMPYAYHAKNAESSAGNFEVIDGDIKFSSATYSGGIIFSDGSYQITAAGTSLWVTSGADIYNVNTSNVGIGISNPSEKLEVAGNIKVSGGITAGSGNVNIIGIDGKIPALNSTYIANLDGSVLTNLTAANISGGNFANADYNFPGSITISTLTASSATLTNVSIFGALGSDLDADGYKIINLGAPSEDSDAANKIYVDNATGGGAGNVAILYATQTFTGQNTFIADVNISTNLFITSGNMGIGIINPSEKLEVLGNIKATAFQGSGSAITNLTAANISAGNLGSSVITSSIAVGAIDNESQIADGIITNADLAGSIADDKLSQIITTGKVSGAALTLLGSIASGAGFLPNANIDNSSITKLGAALEDAEIPNDITLTNITQITNRDISDTIGNLAVSRVTGGSLPSDVIASSIAVGAIDNENQIVDGTITNADLAGLIDDSKLNQIITAGKISDSALTTNVILSDNNQNITGIKTFTSSLTVISPDTVPSSLWVSTSASTSHLYVSTAGYVGIGTTGPERTLHVIAPTGVDLISRFDSDDASAYISLNDNSTTGESFVMLGAEGDDMKFRTGDSEAMRILANGNVGIGTMTPGYRLDLRSASAHDVDHIFARFDTSASNRGLVLGNIVGTGEYYPYIQGFYNGVTGGSLLINPNGGNVGIGTTGPSAHLEIEDNSANIATGVHIDRSAGAAVGANSTLKGLYVNQQSANDTTAAYAIDARVAHNLGQGGVYGVKGVADGIVYATNGPGIGIYGLANQTNMAGLGTAIGVKGEVSGILVGGAGTTYAGYFENTTTVAGNNYGIYVITANSADYGIYQTGTGDNYFAGNVGIGTTSPTAKLEVVGDTVSSRFYSVTVQSALTPSGVPVTIYDTTGQSGIWLVSIYNYGDAANYGAFAIVNVAPGGASVLYNVGRGLMPGVTTSGSMIQATQNSGASQYITGTLIKIL